MVDKSVSHDRLMAAAIGCDTCKFCGIMMGGAASKEIVLICRKSPPTVSTALIMTPTGPGWQTWAGWGPVQKTDWCGAWEAKLN